MLGSVTTSALHGAHADQSSVEFASAQGGYLFDALDANMWLSWGWCEPWHELGSASSMPFFVDPVTESFGSIVSDAQAPAADDQSLAVGIDVAAADLDSPRDAFAKVIDARIDPLEHHRRAIVAYIKASSASPVPERTRWLGRSHFPRLLKTFFLRQHRHTPIIHLPTFNVVTAPTSIVFAIALMAASYIPKLGLVAADTIALAETAYTFALKMDEVRIAFPSSPRRLSDTFSMTAFRVSISTVRRRSKLFRRCICSVFSIGL